MGVFFEIFWVSFGFGGKNPDVGVENFFAGDAGENHFSIEGLLLRQSYFFANFKILSDVWHLPNPTTVLFRNDLGMTGRARIDVKKSQKVVVFVDDVGRDFFGDDFAENAGFHNNIITPPAPSYNKRGRHRLYSS